MPLLSFLTKIKIYVIMEKIHKLNKKGIIPMMNINLNELSALEFVLKYVSVKDLLTYTTIGFSDCDTSERGQDNADICTKAVQVFLQQ